MEPTGKLFAFNGAGQQFQLLNMKVPALKPGEVLVKNLYTTICGSDMHTYCGLRTEKTPTVLGHEIVGEIIAIGEAHPGNDYAGNDLKIGDRITWSVFSSNPLSELAKRGMPQKSDQLFKYGHAQITEANPFHGGLGEYCILKENTTLLKIPLDVPLPVAATINCAVATVAGALRLAGDISGKNILITGMGLLGIVCAAMCKVAGAQAVNAADINQQRLDEALLFGADTSILLSKAQPEQNIDIVFDMSGAPAAMETGLESLATGGTAVWIGAVFSNRKVNIDAEQVIRRMITIKGLHNYNHEDLLAAVDFISQHHHSFPFKELIGPEFSFNDTQKAFEYAKAHLPLRVGIRIA
ncbi:zinc-binding dehydrogenase [Mucilaginibacter sp.]|uniref:zinc-binding dehydrogenase n=1 Tax=Mucilaginibacter sp. TaxID=1882438 RepID=UPI0025DC69C4|nr:zinc-binding dehydrogenase [Mucilaginibacter sp.]